MSGRKLLDRQRTGHLGKLYFEPGFEPLKRQFFSLPDGRGVVENIAHRCVHNASSGKWGTVLKVSSEMRFCVKTNSVSEALRKRQAISSAARSGAASAQRTAVPMKPPDVKSAMRRPEPSVSTI